LNSFGYKTAEQYKINELEEKLFATERLKDDELFAELAGRKTELSGASKHGKQISALSSIHNIKKTAAQFYVLYLTNQFIFRGVNVRASELITRGFEIRDGDERGVKLCTELIDRSGGPDLFWRLNVSTDVAGDGWLEKVLSKDKKHFFKLEHIHPATFTYKTDINNNIIVNSMGNPVSCVQIVPDKEGIDKTIDVPIDRVEHLKYITIGDELTGTSAIQPVYNTAVRLMNMENAAANAAVKTANPLWIGQSDSKSPRDLFNWNKILGRISSREQIMLPAGMTLDMKSPGQQNFNEYADYFLNAVVAALGVPRPILLGASEGSNRANSIVLSKHFYSIIRSNQQYQSLFFNNIFKQYGELAGFTPPKLYFNDVAENAESNFKSAIELFNAGIINQQEARMMIGLEKLDMTLEKSIKNSDKKAWHPAKPGSPEGSQSGNKATQKLDPSVKSVR